MTNANGITEIKRVAFFRHSVDAVSFTVTVAITCHDIDVIVSLNIDNLYFTEQTLVDKKTNKQKTTI